jgi:HlyD family secretion protein
MKKTNIVLLCLFIITANIFIYYINRMPSNAYADDGIPAVRGEIEESDAVTAGMQGRITKVHFKEGDSVNAGDLMYELDDSSLRMEIDALKESINRAQLEASNAQAALNRMKVTAPFSGYVSNIAVSKGDFTDSGSTVLTLTDLSRLKVLVPFSSRNIEGIKPGQKASVFVYKFLAYCDGTVSYVSSMPRYTDEGGKLYDVEVVLDNPGALKEGMDVSVDIIGDEGKIQAITDGRLEYVNRINIRAGAEGTVKSINLRENQYVDRGSLLVELENISLISARDFALLNLQALRSELARKTDMLENYKVYAPAGGTISNQSAAEGVFVYPGDELCTIIIS